MGGASASDPCKISRVNTTKGGAVWRRSDMQIPSAQLTISSGASRVTVHPGDLIGRLASADVVISDPRVSEAHALVSLRRRSLRLLGLRGALSVDGHEVDAVTLAPGVRVDLAEGLAVTVERVELPTHTLMLCGTAQGAVELGASSYSLVSPDGAGPRVLRLMAGYVQGAAAHLWYSGACLWIRPRGLEAEPIETGGRWTIEGCPLRVIQVPLDGANDTVVEDGSPERVGLVIVARYTSVHLQCGDRTSVLTGRPANLVSELVGFAGKPVAWEVVSRQLWGTHVDRELLRDNFDSTRSRLRRQLRDLGVREDLVLLDGSGNVELVLYPGDRLVDET